MAPPVSVQNSKESYTYLQHRSRSSETRKLCSTRIITQTSVDTNGRAEAFQSAGAMAPNATSGVTGVLFEDDRLEAPQGIKPRGQGQDQDQEQDQGQPRSQAPAPPRQIVWRNVVLFAYLHAAALYGAFLMLTSARLLTSAYAIFLYQASALGITAGAHRLWSHRAYKAKWPLRVILMVFNTLAFQNHIYEWSRDHRVHHKYSETDADPHNATRGFFFSHVGWLLVRKHPDVKTKGKGIDLHDLEQDKVVMFQKKYYHILMPLTCFIIPTIIPVYMWNETWSNAWFVATLFRYTLTLNMTWLVNSAAHMWGSKPYDKYINPAENLGVALGAMGEGWHNYHHVFPWDYKAAELGNYRANLTTAFIDFFARIGWAYDLKTVPKTIIQKRVERTGDGSHEIWGWGDKDMSQEDIDAATIQNRKTQ